ncbi:uncharacterized protein LOC111056842 [Nilaparvata lugens]|uniref:uncharacterized protein LOC111056842 n=1 Tax=Nilaparvata lugens TaxID=108931 RepID=UPI00193DA5BE|nr:uncharacterized protein LOC111056842 [Nilaparvata lugens]
MDEYRTKVFEYNQEAHASQDDIFRKYFVVTEREVWACMKEGDSTLFNSHEESDVFFMRIVHKLHGTTEIIGKIFYYDGMEVERVPSLWNKDRKSETVSVTEVKYIRLSDFKIMRYDGFVELLDPSYDIVDRISMLNPIEVFQNDRKLKDRNLHKDNVGAKGIHYEKVGSKGDKWSVGSNPEETVGTDKQIAVCTRITDDPRLYSGQFMPKIRKEIMSYVMLDRRRKTYKQLAWYQLIEYFTVTNQELWRCTISQPKEADKIFLRRVTEIVGRNPVAYIVYSQTMDVWKFQLSVNNQTESVKIRDFHYFLPENNKQVYFYGELELLEPETDKNYGKSNDETRPGIEIYSVPVENDDMLRLPIPKK